MSVSSVCLQCDALSWWWHIRKTSTLIKFCNLVKFARLSTKRYRRRRWWAKDCGSERVIQFVVPFEFGWWLYLNSQASFTESTFGTMNMSLKGWNFIAKHVSLSFLIIALGLLKLRLLEENLLLIKDTPFQTRYLMNIYVGLKFVCSLCSTIDSLMRL